MMVLFLNRAANVDGFPFFEDKKTMLLTVASSKWEMMSMCVLNTVIYESRSRLILKALFAPLSIYH